MQLIVHQFRSKKTCIKLKANEEHKMQSTAFQLTFLIIERLKYLTNYQNHKY